MFFISFNRFDAYGEENQKREKPRNYDFYQWRNGAELQGGGSGWGSDDMLSPMSNDVFKLNLIAS